MLSLDFNLGLITQIAIVAGYFLAEASGQAQIFMRVRGANLGRIAMGFQWSTEVLLVNRIGAAAYFFMLALYIESGGTLERLILLLSLGLALTIIFNVWMIINLSRSPNFSGLRVTLWAENSILTAAFVATLFSVMGMTIPYFAGIFYPEYRLTLANSSFLLNTFFTILIVFIVDKRVAIYIDSSNQRLDQLAALVIGFKTLGLLFMTVAFLILYYFWLVV